MVDSASLSLPIVKHPAYLEGRDRNENIKLKDIDGIKGISIDEASSLSSNELFRLIDSNIYNDFSLDSIVSFLNLLYKKNPELVQKAIKIYGEGVNYASQLRTPLINRLRGTPLFVCPRPINKYGEVIESRGCEYGSLTMEQLLSRYFDVKGNESDIKKAKVVLFADNDHRTKKDEEPTEEIMRRIAESGDILLVESIESGEEIKNYPSINNPLGVDIRIYGWDDVSAYESHRDELLRKMLGLASVKSNTKFSEKRLNESKRRRNERLISTIKKMTGNNKGIFVHGGRGHILNELTIDGLRDSGLSYVVLVPKYELENNTTVDNAIYLMETFGGRIGSLMK